MENQQSINVGDKLTLEIRKQGINGEGIGYYRKLAIFVQGAILRETVVAQILDIKPGYALAKVESIVTQSEQRIPPACPFYERCGGCQMLHINYLEQLKIKQSILKQSLRRYTNLNVELLDIKRTLGMKANFGYRNKSQMPFKNINIGLALGLYEANSNKFVCVDTCLIQDPIVNQTNQKVLEILTRNKVMAADAMNPEGILLNLVTRYVQSTNSLQISLIVSKYKPVLMEVAQQIMVEIANVKGVFYSENSQHSTLMFGKTVELLLGEPYVLEKVGDLLIKLSPEAFHQLNTGQMNLLYDRILKACHLTGKEIVIDAFCGVGITTMQIARQARIVYGIDYSVSSIKDANANAALNKIKNVTFFSDRVEKVLPMLFAKAEKPDIIILDPPRSGLDDPIMEELLKSKIKMIIYVSCNPSTLAKNISKLTANYEIEFIQPIDMFPHTASVESLTVFKLKETEKPKK